MSFYWYLLCYSRTPPQADFYGFLRQLWDPRANIVGGIPSLTVLPDWPGGSRSLWHSVVKEFMPYTMRESWQPVENMPASEKQWRKTVADEALKKKLALPLTEHGVRFYSALTDIYGWALRYVMKYYRYRVHSEVADVLFYERPKSQQACAHLVKLFFDLAQARYNYHILVAHHVARVSKRVQRRKHDKEGRPRRLRGEKKRDEDLWLILIWPVACRKRWTYQDVVRALRLHFQRDRFGNPQPLTPPQEIVRSLKNGDGALPQRETDWRQEVLRVSRAEKETMQARCQRLPIQLPRLPKRRRSQPDVAAVPPYFALVDRFENWEGNLASCDFKASKSFWDACRQLFKWPKSANSYPISDQ